MSFPVDHIMSIVRDRKEASDFLASLGFEVSPSGFHEGRGTSNNLLFFDNIYWEIMGIDQATQANRSHRILLDRGGGLCGCALKTENLEADLTRARAQSLQTGEVIRIERDVELEGHPQTARFSVAFMETTPPMFGQLFFCQHHTPHLVWPRKRRAHPNGAVRIAKLFYVSGEGARPQFLADGGKEPGIVSLTIEQHQRRFPEYALSGDATPRFTALEIEVTDLAAVERIARKRDVPFVSDLAGLRISHPTLGMQPLVFSQAGADES